MGEAFKRLRENFNKFIDNLYSPGIKNLLRKTKISLLVLILLAILLPVGVFLIEQEQIFFPRAASELIQLGTGDCIKTTKDNKKIATCSVIPLKLINPFFSTSTSPAPSTNGSASVSPTPVPSSTTGGQNINVKSFSNNIQQALDSIKTSGGSVYLPEGVYTVEKKVNVYTNTTIFGDGMGKTIIKLADNVPVDSLMGNDSSAGQSNVVIRDLTLQGPDVPRLTECCHGLKFENITGGWIINVEVNDFGQDGIYLGYKIKSGTPQGVKNVRVTGCKINSNQRQQIGVTMANNVVIDNCTIDGTNKHGQQVYVGIDFEPDDTTTPVTNSYIISNNISNTNIGIALNGANGESHNASTVSNNKVCGNSVNAISTDIADSGQSNQINGGTCAIPDSLVAIPPAPAKPSAGSSLFAKLIGTVFAQNGDSDDEFGLNDTANTTTTTDSEDQFGLGETGNANPTSSSSGVLQYRLAESQAGLSSASYKQFALSPKPKNPLFAWIGNLFNNFPPKISAQTTSIPSGCKKITPVKRSVRYRNCSDSSSTCSDQTSLIERPSGQNENDVDPNYVFDGKTVASYPIKEVVWEFSDGWKNTTFKGPRLEDGDRVSTGKSKFENNSKSYEVTKTTALTGGALQVDYGSGIIAESTFSKQGTNYQGIAGQTYDFSKSYAFVPTDINSSTKCSTISSSGTSGSGTSNGTSGAGSTTGTGGTTGTTTTGTNGTTSTSTTNGPLPVSSGTPTFSIGKQSIDTTFTLANTEPGPKQIWVQFLHPDGSTRVDHITFDFADKVPHIDVLSCNLDIARENLNIRISGQDFGNDIGTITTVSPNKQIEVLGWNDKEITGILKKPDIPINEGQRFKVKIVRPDTFESPIAVCAVDKSLVSLGARLFCREPGKFDVKDVAVTLLYRDERSGSSKLSKVDEKVTIDSDGSIANLKTKLQTDKNYAISVKALSSLRRTGVFTAQEGTTEIQGSDDRPFILPIGDIAPKVSPDGQINALDRAELTRQWRVLGVGDTKLTGDFNQDGRVNSIDWACMSFDFGSSDDPLPVDIPQPASATLRIPGGTTDTSGFASGSPGPSSTPDSSTLAKISVGGKLFLDTNRNQIADNGESFITQGSGTIKFLQIPDSHITGEALTQEELSQSKTLGQTTNSLPGANYDLSVAVAKDSGSSFTVIATANSGQIEGFVDFKLGSPLVNSNREINIPLTSVVR